MGKVKGGDLVPCWFSVRINKRAGLARIKPTDGWMADNKDTTLKDAKLRKNKWSCRRSKNMMSNCY